jgi:alkylated DNA repair dioxygenase AlkB
MPQLGLFDEKKERSLLPGLRYVPELITSAHEVDLLREVDARLWLSDLKRRVQHYGYKYDYRARAIDQSMYVGPLPAFAVELARLLIKEQILENLPDQMIVNEYLPGQGISPHIDCEPCFRERIVTVSLGSQCEMEFIPKEREEAKWTLVLAPRSALLISGDARYQWLHTIRPRQSDHGILRTRRISLTFRNVIIPEQKRSTRP